METQQSNESLGDRMKKYESSFTSQKIDPSLPFAIRLDGHGFSKFTKGLKAPNKPYDWNLHQAFINTTIQVMKEYQADTGYTHSDEISLLFYPKRTKDDSGWREIIYSGKIQKIVSTAAAFCTMVFNRELRTIFENKKNDYVGHESTYERMMGIQAYFDCRIFQLPNDPEMFSYIYWRSKQDCPKNHVSELARAHYSDKQLHKKSTKEKIQMLLDKGVDWEKEPACFRHGSFIKRVQKIIEEGAIRHEFKEIDIDLLKFNDETNEFLKTNTFENK